jgi:peptidoglycan/xylan/chitin deacetylase (PgdA/CDA1 family)
LSRAPSPLDIALTFDDGYLEHFRVAQVLNSLGVRGTFFLISGQESWNGHPLLTRKKELIHRMYLMKHEIGSHTVSHPNMTTLREEEVLQELAESKQRLEEITGSEVRGFAYPYGSFNEVCKRLVSKYYSYARAARDLGAQNADRYSIGIKHPGRNLAFGSILRPLDIAATRKGYALLFHAMPLRSLLIWIRYLQSMHARFVTLREMVYSELGSVDD